MGEPGCFGRLTRWERRGVAAFFAVVALFGCLVELRTCFLSRRMGDLNCYLRPAWAVRTGKADLYQILDDCGWHYNYPPFLAIVLTPLADPPAGEDHAGMVPYPVSVALWYLLSLACLALGVHWLASALEATSPDPAVRQTPFGSRRWWALRLAPVLGCIVPVGHTLMRGQVNLIVVLCLCATAAALVRGRSWRAGWWLAWPVCIKVYPAFLLLYPLVRRDWRFLGGCAAGLVVGLVVVPLAAFGPARTREYYAEYVRVTLAPGLGLGEDLSRSGELTWLTSTDSQSLLAAMHSGLHPERATRPPDASPRLRRVSYLLGGLMTAATLWVMRRRRSGPDVPISFGALVLVMLLLCPICHLHYFSMAVPLVVGLVAASWDRTPAPRLAGWLAAVLLANVVVNALPNLPKLELLRDRALAGYMGLALWAVAVIVLWLRPAEGTGARQQQPEAGRAAA
jgi:hypothetical protein